MWQILTTKQVDEWLAKCDDKTYRLIERALTVLGEVGPRLGRPLVDTVHGSLLRNLKELRPGSSGRSEVRILFVFDPNRNAVLLIAGDKSGQWSAWYESAIAQAEIESLHYLNGVNE